MAGVRPIGDRFDMQRDRPTPARTATRKRMIRRSEVARKTLEDFDWDAHPPLAHRSPLSPPADSSSRRRTWCCSALPAPARPTSPPRWGSSPRGTGIGCCSRQRRTGSPVSPTRIGKGTWPRTGTAAPLRADHRRRGRRPPVRVRCREPVLPARLKPLRTRLADPHLEPAVLRLGRRLRRPGRHCGHDRPHRSPRRRAHLEGRQLPAPRPRHRQPYEHQNAGSGRLTARQVGGLVFTRVVSSDRRNEDHLKGVLVCHLVVSRRVRAVAL